MKRLIFFLTVCGMTYGIYYLVKHKNRFIYKFNTKKEISSDSIKDTIDWKLRYENMYVDNIELMNENEVLNDSINKLRSMLYNHLNRTSQNTINQPANNKNKIKFSKPNEKNLPIARSNDALELKEFYTGRYSNR